MSQPRVLYMGYGETGCFCLSELVAAGFDVAGVFCRANDRTERPGGESSSVFTLTRGLGLPLFEETNPNEPAFLAAIAESAPDLLLSVQYDRILKPPLLAIPRHGAYNLHYGPLPRLRGCFPTKWAILEDEPAGVTFHVIDPGIDSGDVIDQILVPLNAGETDRSLYLRLEEAGRDLFRRQLGWLRTLEPPRRQPQDESRASYHPKQPPYDGILDWERDAVWLERFLRAFTFPPHPAAKTWYEGAEVQLRAPAELGGDLPGRVAGDIVFLDDGRIAIQCGRGSVIVATVLVEGEQQPASELRRPDVPSPRFSTETS